MDYDVAVLGLSSPPPSSVLTPYRPAVSVRNNGIHDALASGTLRIYAADRLTFTTELYSATIPPGETRDALGTDYWTPPAEGNYSVIADLTCPLDQVESNNHLSPTAITVSGGPPPPPTTVAPHGSQHEDGGADEVNIDGLHGRLADAQPALAHKASHMVGGSDAISVEGLPGQLLEAQGIRDHAQTHEALGTDRLNVDGLHGQLYNVQKPDVHNNSAHDPNYSINKHGAVDHNADVEAVSRKGHANGYAGLGANGYVPPDQLGLYIANVQDTFALRKDQSWGPADPRHLAGIASGVHITDNSTFTLLDTHELKRPDGTHYSTSIDLFLTSTVGANTLLLVLKAGDSIAALTPVSAIVLPIAAGAANKRARAELSGTIVDGSIEGCGISFSSLNGVTEIIFPTGSSAELDHATYLQLTAKLALPGSTTNLWVYAAHIFRHSL